MRLDDIQVLACPRCRAPLAPDGEAREGHLLEGRISCRGCGASWPVAEGLPRLYREEEVRGTDRLMRYIYDGLPSLHDPATRFILPLLQAGGSEDSLREGYLPRIELPRLAPRADGRPVRILEVGIGAGANLPRVRREIPQGLEVEIWGLDLSRGMLRQCQKALARTPDARVRLLMADAHALPFPDHSFDRVFHVGALGSYRDPRKALAEMARVAEPGTPIVAVDEQLDPERRHSVYHRLTFRMLTFYDGDPHCPRELLPEGAVDVIEEQVSRFYYCLTFRMGAGGTPT
jgi:SAM-dependent methyltransferase